jgi:hypothetical protein
MRRIRIVVAVVLAVAAGTLVTGWDHSGDPMVATAPTTTPAPSFTYGRDGIVAQLAHVNVLPGCATEDGGPVLPCRWDARTMGDGTGESFAMIPVGPTRVAIVRDNGVTTYSDR